MKDLLLLHGALGSKDQFDPLMNELKDQFRVHAFNFNGHGGKPFAQNPFSIPHFAEEVLQFIEDNKIESPHVFGYSMGGYVAMWVASQDSLVFDKIITLATKYEWDDEIAAREVKMLDPQVIEEKVPAFAAQLKERHSPNDWKVLLSKTADLLKALGKEPPLTGENLSSVENKCLLLLGDRDKMISRLETEIAYGQIPNSQMKILADAPHPLEQVNVLILADVICGFLKA